MRSIDVAVQVGLLILAILTGVVSNLLTPKVRLGAVRLSRKRRHAHVLQLRQEIELVARMRTDNAFLSLWCSGILAEITTSAVSTAVFFIAGSTVGLLFTTADIDGTPLVFSLQMMMYMIACSSGNRVLNAKHQLKQHLKAVSNYDEWVEEQGKRIDDLSATL